MLGSACGLGIEGSGWIIAPGLVVTNAHVVAGESDTVVQDGGHSPSLTAVPVSFNTRDDIALLRVPGLSEPALSVASARGVGTAAAILGYPEDGPFDAEPGRIGRTLDVRTQDAYGRGSIVRSITPMRGLVRPGNSGGPMVDAAGQVVATVFAAVTGGAASGQGPGGFAVPNALVLSALAQARGRTGPISTGACAG